MGWHETVCNVLVREPTRKFSTPRRQPTWLLQASEPVPLPSQAIKGNAIDRHLLGLKLQSIEDLVSIPELFMDTAYAVAMHFNLSTSQVGIG